MTEEDFFKFGRQLEEVRRTKSYTDKYPTFTEYMTAEHGLDRWTAYRYIKSYNVMLNLLPMGNIKFFPKNLRQVRPLLRLTPQMQRKAWNTVNLRHPSGNFTSTHIEHIVQSMLTPDYSYFPNTLVDGLQPNITVPLEILDALKIEAKVNEITVDVLMLQIVERFFQGKINPLKRRKVRKGYRSKSHYRKKTTD